MKERNKLILIGLASVVLIVNSLINDPDIEIILRFIVCSVFLWLGIIIDKKSFSGFKYFFFCLSIFFNPFYPIVNLKFKFIDLITSLVLFYLVFHYSISKSYLITHKKKILIFFTSIFSILLIVFLIQLRVRYVEESEYEKYLIKLEREKFLEDSINQVLQAEKNKRRELLQIENCTEEKILIYFKEHMDFYYPQWEIKSKVKVNKVAECDFQLSLQVRNSKYYSSFLETLIVEINIPLYEGSPEYEFKKIKSPIGF